MQVSGGGRGEWVEGVSSGGVEVWQVELESAGKKGQDEGVGVGGWIMHLVVVVFEG